MRQATVDSAKAARDRAAAEVNITKLQIATGAADAFLTIAAAQQTVVAAAAGVERARVINQVIETLATNQLRPGADASRSRAELALARTQEIQAEQAVDVARAALAQLLGTNVESVSIEPGSLLQLPSSSQVPSQTAAQHPLAIAGRTAVAEVKAREKELDRSYYPRFFLEGSTYARGTGIQPDGRPGGEAGGLGPNIQNWAVALNITFPSECGFIMVLPPAGRGLGAVLRDAEANGQNAVLCGQRMTGTRCLARFTFLSSFSRPATFRATPAGRQRAGFCQHGNPCCSY